MWVKTLESEDNQQEKSKIDMAEYTKRRALHTLDHDQLLGLIPQQTHLADQAQMKGRPLERTQ